MPSLATFNANNFFLRYKFSKTYPGDQSRASLTEAVNATVGYLPGTLGGYSPRNYIVWDSTRRQLAAAALSEPDNRLPDILCFQEVENIQAIRALNDHYFDGHYPYSLLVDSYDPRNIDVGLLSRFPIEEIHTHIDDTGSDGKRIFSRDCLEANIHLPDGATLALFLNHLKSKLVKKKSGESSAKYHNRIRNSHNRRKRQAREIAKIIAERFAGQHDSALYAVVGDFNDTPHSPYLKPLMTSSHLTDVIREHRHEDDCWTYYWRNRNRASQIDYVLCSRALAARVRQRVTHNSNRRPYIERGGISYKLSTSASQHVLDARLVHFEEDPVTLTPIGSPPASKKIAFDFERYDLIWDDWKNNISDHCPVKVWF